MHCLCLLRVFLFRFVGCDFLLCWYCFQMYIGAPSPPLCKVLVSCWLVPLRLPAARPFVRPTATLLTLPEPLFCRRHCYIATAARSPIAAAIITAAAAAKAAADAALPTPQTQPCTPPTPAPLVPTLDKPSFLNPKP